MESFEISIQSRNSSTRNTYPFHTRTHSDKKDNMVQGEKRSLDDESIDRDTKRSNTGNVPLLKLLVPNYAAGGLIGKGGSLMVELQERFGGKIRLSANNGFYPGTEERIVVLTGEVSEIIDLNNHIMEKVQGDPSKDLDGRGQKTKIVLTNSAAGLLIGRGGQTIKSIQEESKAKISISSIDSASVPQERVLTMTGSMDERTEGCRQVINTIACEASNMANTNVKYLGNGASFGGNSGFNNSLQKNNDNLLSVLSGNMLSGFSGPTKRASPSSQKTQLKTKVEVQMEVPDSLVGAILGKQGVVIRELALRSGARFKFSDKNDFAEGTNDRILTITGDMNQTYSAHTLVNEKVDQAASIQRNRSF